MRFCKVKYERIFVYYPIGMHVGSLGTRIGRVEIAWDDFYFMDQE